MAENKFKFIVAGDKEEWNPSKWAPSSPDALPKRHPETHVKVLIVGAGFAGLMLALESWRKGHTVVGILERNQGPNFSGDLVIVQPSAMSIMHHWPDMIRDIEADKVDAPTYYVKHTGEVIYGPSDATYNDPEHLAERGPGFPYVGSVQIRKKFFLMLLRQVARIGITVEYGQRVESYFEDEEAGLGGVLVKAADGTTSARVAHLVAACDAFKSQSELLVAGEHLPTRSAGMSIYRCSYPRELAHGNEIISKRWGEEASTKEYWLGPGMHIGIYVSPEMMAFGLTPRDQFLLEENEKPQETWDPDVDPEDVVKVLRRVPEWDQAIEEMVRLAPKGSVIHWPLTWRNLHRNWTSKGGRVVQLGDAAHATVPSSASGATLALEDAITLASCLQLSSSAAGGAGAPLGARIFNLLQYQRASCIQKMSFVNAQLMNSKTANWDAIKADPKKVRIRFAKWVFRHNPEAYVYEKYGPAFAHIVTGAEFENSNIPPGHKFVPWTIDEVERDIAAGKRIEDLLDGDWT